MYKCSYVSDRHFDRLWTNDLAVSFSYCLPNSESIIYGTDKCFNAKIFIYIHIYIHKVVNPHRYYGTMKIICLAFRTILRLFTIAEVVKNMFNYC